MVGGGAAGLSAALILGRARRRVLLCDAGRPRNRWARAMHGYLSRDGIAPAEFLALGRAELRRYPSVEVRPVAVTDADCTGDGFVARLANGDRHVGATLLLATGVEDVLPPIPNIEAFYGVSVHHCPYCDAWEQRDQPFAVYGRGDAGVGMALALTKWSDDVVLCTDGPAALRDRDRATLDAFGVPVRKECVVGLEGREGQLERIVFDTGPPLARRALFFSSDQRQTSRLAAKLGCTFNRRGTVATLGPERTGVPGLFVAGDASKDTQLVVVAAAEGAQAAVAIDAALNAAAIRHMQEGLATRRAP